jgi:hypothetical protein
MWFRLFLVSAIVLSLVASRTAFAEDKPGEGKSITLEYELDPYYSNVDIYIGLTDRPIPDVGEKSELEIYRDLFLSSYMPRFLVFEASINPMPLLGVYIRDQSPGLYGDAEVSEDLNIIKAVTAGFEEPWALSAFLGDVVNYTKPGEENRYGNKGFQGYLFSFGNQHIKDNELIKDYWYEIEWKIKGDREFKERKMHWSFRVGEKLHTNRDIADVLYLSIRRSRLDFDASASSILKNSGFEYTYEMDNSGFSPVSHHFFVEKKWPFKKMRAALTLAVGFIWDLDRKYTGNLDNSGDGDSFQIVFRPNIEF